MAVIAAHALLVHKIDVDTETYNQPVRCGEIQAAESADQNMLALAHMSPWKFNGGVTLWFSFFLASLGHALLEYFSGVVEKMEKLEYYWSSLPPVGPILVS